MHTLLSVQYINTLSDSWEYTHNHIWVY